MMLKGLTKFMSVLHVMVMEFQFYQVCQPSQVPVVLEAFNSYFLVNDVEGVDKVHVCLACSGHGASSLPSLSVQSSWTTFYQ